MKLTFAFQSKLGPTMARYLELNFALGKQYKHEVTTFKSLDRFLSQLPRASQNLTVETFHDWCQSQSRLTARVRRYRMLMVQRFCRYRRRTVPDCFIPDSILFPPPNQTVTPHIFSEAEVARLMSAASGLEPHPYSPLRPEVVRLAIVLLYTTGLRVGELLRLVVGDFDPRESTLLVRNSKFYKSRILPLRPDVVRELEHFLKVRRKHKFPAGPSTPFIWNQRRGGKAYSAWGLQCNLWATLDTCNIRARSGRRPRVHDFRHYVASRTMPQALRGRFLLEVLP